MPAGLLVTLPCPWTATFKRAGRSPSPRSSFRSPFADAVAAHQLTMASYGNGMSSNLRSLRKLSSE